MPQSERTPLLSRGSQNGAIDGLPAPSVAGGASAFIRGEGQPGWLHSFKFFVFGTWFNILLLFVPLSAVAHYLNWDAAYRFTFSFLAIVPLASMLGTATEEISQGVGPTIAGLLNASFGNAVEIIVGVAALLHDQILIVQTSLLGSILSNILLVLGCSFTAAGFKRKESRFQTMPAQASSSLMTLACITLVIPAAYHSTRPDVPTLPDAGLTLISRGTAIVLLLVYAAYIWFQLKTHASFFLPAKRDGDEENGGAPSAPSAPQPETTTAEETREPAQMSTAAAALALCIVTVITSFCADYLVASIEEFAERYHVPKAFIGLILLPIVANAAEHVTAVWMAMKDEMELTIGICVGSSIQIASFVVPLLVVIGWVTNHELTLFFANFETIVLFVSVLLVNTLIQDGKSNYMEGLMLIALYFVVALAFWVA